MYDTFTLKLYMKILSYKTRKRERISSSVVTSNWVLKNLDECCTSNLKRVKQRYSDLIRTCNVFQLLSFR